MSFTRFFNPRSIAVIGASEEPTRIGSEPVRALRENGYAGEVYPVNPRYDTVFGYRCYPALEAVGNEVDLAVIAIPAGAVREAVRACVAKGVRYAVVLGGGFRETGVDGAALQDELVAIARGGGLRLYGPNCLGFANLPGNVFACFGSITRAPKLRRGPVSLVTQSGGFGYTIALDCARHGIGFRNILATGNEADLDCVELIEALVDDPGTEAILVYLEGLRDGRAFVRAGEKAMRAGKPLLVWKGGATSGGARAAASHTANMVGVYDFFQAAFRAGGMVELRELQDASDFVKAFRSTRYPAGKRVAVMGGSGGSAIVFTDAIERHGCRLAQFSDETLATLRSLLPPIGSAVNPVDFTAGFIATRGPEKYADAVRAVARDSNVDALCFTLATIGPKGAQQAADVLAGVAREVEKPFFVFLALDALDAPEAHATFDAARIPVFSSPVRAGRAIAVLADYAERKAQALSAPESTIAAVEVELPAQPFTLSERESKAVLHAAGITISADRFSSTAEGIDVTGLSGPVVVKLVSRAIQHKTEIGAVRTGVAPSSASAVAAEMLAHVRSHAPETMIDGVLVCEQVQGGFEMLLGCVRDPAFGPVVVLGIGGIYAEALNDRTCRLAPVGIEAAHRMIGELACASVLRGARGQRAFDVDALARTIVAVSQLAWAKRDVIGEIDVNPLFVMPQGRGVIAADALIVGVGDRAFA